jgi:hypothetical protein
MTIVLLRSANLVDQTRLVCRPTCNPQPLTSTTTSEHKHIMTTMVDIKSKTRLRPLRSQPRRTITWIIFIIVGILIVYIVIPNAYNLRPAISSNHIAVEQTAGLSSTLSSSSFSVVSSSSSSSSSCRYHGNCPIGTSCVVVQTLTHKDDSSSVSFVGECQPYQGPRNDTLTVSGGAAATTKTLTNSQVQQQSHHHDLCVSSCWEELQWDEWFYYRSKPVILQTFLANNGHGCVVTYQRQIMETKPPLSPTLEEWMAGRFQRVIRVDPWIPDSYDISFQQQSPQGDSKRRRQQQQQQQQVPPKKNPIRWNALCNAPCQKNQDCATGMTCVSRQYMDHDAKKTCQQEAFSRFSSSSSSSKKTSNTAVVPRNNNNNNNDDQDDMVIVTGANSHYFRGLKNFAASVQYWASRHKLVVYNLGLTTDQLAQVQSWPVVQTVHWPQGIPESYPIHVRTNLQNYAWKSIIINETVHAYKSIFWLDAGATLVGPIQPIQEIVHQTGLFLVHGQDDDMKPKSHGGTYAALGYEKSTFQGGPHCAGGIQGHVYPSRYIDTIVIPNAQCALDESCIAPPTSSLDNHRYDQTSLSILAYQYHVAAPHYTEYLAASRTQLRSDMSQSNRMIIWTARNSCQYYSQLPGLLTTKQ